MMRMVQCAVGIVAISAYNLLSLALGALLTLPSLASEMLTGDSNHCIRKQAVAIMLLMCRKVRRYQLIARQPNI